MTLGTADLLVLLTGAALLSSALTVAVLSALYHWFIQPRLERRLDERLNRAADEVEARIRARLGEILGGRSKELLQRRAREWARTGRDLLTPLRPEESNDDRQR
jgi:hypothetical protein